MGGNADPNEALRIARQGGERGHLVRLQSPGDPGAGAACGARKFTQPMGARRA